MSKNKFEIHGDIAILTNPDWNFSAFVTIRDDYVDELKSVTWSKKGDYLYSANLKCYLHIYIMKKWYGEDEYLRLKNNRYVIDHMDNNGYNCCIDNLCFLNKDENTAKGLTVDKMSKVKTHIALSLYKDFLTQLIQMTIVFNYPAKAMISDLKSPAVIELVCLLYDINYEIIINDARQILYNYGENYSFEPEKLHHADFHIEGSYGAITSVERYNEYLSGRHGNGVAFIHKKAPIGNWTLNNKRQFFHLSGDPKIDEN